MAGINYMFGWEDDAANAEQAARQGMQKSGQPGQGGLIASVLDLLGVGTQVAKGGKESQESADLAAREADPSRDSTEDSQDVVQVAQDVLQTTGRESGIRRLPLAPLELGPLPALSGQGVPAPLAAIDPTTGRPWGQ